MINPNALPQSATVQDFQNFGDDLNSTDYNDTLNAMRYMQGQRQPTGGLNRLPQVTVPMQEGGMMEEAVMEKQNMKPEEAMLMEQVEQQDPRQPNPEAQALAQQVASYGRGGDKLLLHVRPDELQGLASMLTITINPETGMPEAFLKGLRRAVSNITKPVRKIAKSKAFKTIAPIALAIAAPYALGSIGAFGLPAASSMTALQFGATTGLGSLAGNLLAGRKFGDAAKAALITGATAGIGRGISNKMAGNTFNTGQPIDKTQAISSTNIVTDPSAAELARLQEANPVSSSFVGPSEGSSIGYTGGANQAKLSQLTSDLTTSPVSDTTRLALGIPEATTLDKIKLAKDAVVSGVKDRYTFDKAGGLNLLKDVATADIGASAVEMDNVQQQALEDQQLAQAGYSVAYPSGFGTQRVIRDSSGVVTNLTAADILSRALGGGRMQFAPQTTFAPTAVAAQGGLVELAQGGEFSGMVPGDGGGMEDNVYMPIKEGPEQVGTLAVSPSEYVVDSYTMAALGGGNPAEGAKVMDETIKNIRKKAYGNTKQPKEVDGLSALTPMVQGV